MTRIEASWLKEPAAQAVCGILAGAGHQAWFVGGCVRNVLLGEPVAVIPTGIEHGTVTIVVDDIPIEITTFRRDVATDGRRATVAFADNIIDDARRRDFTMNALYAGLDGVVVDPLGGLPDLYARRIRFIEDAEQRIKEDYLRILRFFRFHAWYGGDAPDADAMAACAQNIEGLQNLSVERITSELLKLLSAPNPAPSVAAFGATGGLTQILPGAAPNLLAVLVYVEEQANLIIDPLRRMAILGGEPRQALRLSKDQLRHLEQIQADMPHPEAAYRFGSDVGP